MSSHIYVTLNQDGSKVFSNIEPSTINKEQRVFVTYPNVSIDDLVFWQGYAHIENHAFEEITSRVEWKPPCNRSVWLAKKKVLSD